VTRPLATASRADRPRLRRLVAIVGAALVLAATVAAPAQAARPDAGRSAHPSGVIKRLVPDRAPALTPVASGTVGIRSSLGWSYDDGSIAIVGEILNRTGTRRTDILITVTYYNASNAPLGTNSDHVALLRVADGMTGAFVVFDDSPPAGVATYTIATDAGTSTSARAGGGLDLLKGATVISAGTRTYNVKITNPNLFGVTDPFLILTAYNAANEVVEVQGVTAPDLAATANETVQIGIADDLFSDPDPSLRATRVAFVADGFRTGQTSTYITSWDNYFDDIADTSFRNDIIWLAGAHITTGCAAGRYCPDANVKRDQMASFLARALELSGTAPDAFTDDNDDIHEANINRIAQAGITSGCAPSKYCPAANVRRDEMASFLARSLDLSGSAPDAFTDDNGNTHEANINLVAQADVTSGCGGTKYCPASLVTRGQMAAFLRRAFQ
jgi:hypothetical protein